MEDEFRTREIRKDVKPHFKTVEVRDESQLKKLLGTILDPLTFGLISLLFNTKKEITYTAGVTTTITIAHEKRTKITLLDDRSVSYSDWVLINTTE